MDTKAFKRSLQQSIHYHRKGFGHEAEVMGVMNTEYQSSLIQKIRNNNYRWQQGDITIHLAEALLKQVRLGVSKSKKFWA